MHQLHSQRWCGFSQTALQWFQVLLGLSPVLPGLLPPLPQVLPTLSGVLPACQNLLSVPPALLSTLPDLLLALPGDFRWTPDLLYPHIYFAIAPRCTWRPLHQSSQLWALTTLGFWSNNSQTLPVTNIPFADVPLVSHILEATWWMGSGDNFTTYDSAWLHMGNVKAPYLCTNQVNYFQTILKDYNQCTSFIYVKEMLWYLSLYGW